MKVITRALAICIGLVWLINGLVCKVLGLVPRHEQIVARILGDEYSHPITILIGLGEICLAIWFWIRLWPKFNAFLQMALVATMNILEFILASDLLLWGRLNILYATIFIAIVYIYEFFLMGKKRENPTG